MQNKKELEEEKIALTKQYEALQKQINYYNLDEIASGNDDFKDLINRRDRARSRINQIKKALDNN